MKVYTFALLNGQSVGIVYSGTTPPYPGAYLQGQPQGTIGRLAVWHEGVAISSREYRMVNGELQAL